MKTNKSHILLLLAFTAVLSGCSVDELSGNSPAGSGSPLRVSVTDNGYNDAAAPQAKENANTRARENGYKTEFTSGDKIGLYAVRNSTIVAENIELTYDGANWTCNTTLYYEGTGTRYFAYYPYQIIPPTNKLVPSAGNAAGFFAPVIAEWTTPEDQSSYDAYTGADLMIGEGTIDGSPGTGTRTLRFGMTHQMALAVFNLPKIRYKFNNESPTIPDYIIPYLTFNGFTPRPMEDDMYRYLVAPGKGKELSGSYTTSDGKTKEFICNVPADLTAATYKEYKVDGGIINKQHTLQAGDFYMKDGSLIGKGETLTPAQQQACIGIVFYAGHHPDDSFDYSSSGIHQEKCHGYVMALTDVNSGESDRLKWEWKESDDQAFKQRVGTSTSESDWNGYSNTQLIKTFVTNSQPTDDVWKMTNFPAANGCLLYGTENCLLEWQKSYAAPSNSSGWFLPSAGQLKYLYDNSSDLQSRIETLATSLGNTHIKWFNASNSYYDYYWSSSENSIDGAWQIYSSDGSMSNYAKNNLFYVRAVCAF